MSVALDPALIEAVTRFAALPRVLVALDFDGTLAPEVDVPDEARALPEAHEAIRDLAAAPNTVVALVSGRSLDSLARAGRVPSSVPLVGSHGLEVRLAVDDVRPAATPADRARVDALRAVIAPLVEMVDGAWIERKPAGFAVHTRTVDPPSARALTETVREAARRADPDLTVRDGKNLIEFAVRDATKGDGLAVLREEFRPDAVLFAGDDVTDEDALAMLTHDDLGIKVGAAPTVASHRVSDPQGMSDVLRLLASLRAEPAPGGSAHP